MQLYAAGAVAGAANPSDGILLGDIDGFTKAFAVRFASDLGGTTQRLEDFLSYVARCIAEG